MIRARVAERSYVIPARVRRRRAFCSRICCEVVRPVLGISGAKNNRAENNSKKNGRASSQVVGVRFVWLGSSIAFSQLKTGFFWLTLSRVYFSHADIGLMV